MRIFISGALNSDSIGFMKNIRKMLQIGRDVENLGVRTYVPINDFMMTMVCGCIEHEDYYEKDLLELTYCDAMVLVPGYEESTGVVQEILAARELNIPIFETVNELKTYIGENK